MTKKRTGRKLRIFLGDLVHNYIYSRDIWTVPLNVANIAAYVRRFYGQDVDIRLFKFPDNLLNELKKSPPDVLALSNYIWNSELSRHFVRVAKSIDPEMITIIGGSNARMDVGFMSGFMKDCGLDYYISSYGEDPFKCLVGAILRNGKDPAKVSQDREIHGIWFSDKDKRQAC